MFSIFRDEDQLESVEKQLVEMIDGGIAMFDLATKAIFRESSPDDVSEELWGIDKSLNKTERAIRRELLIHGTVRGAEVDQGLMLAYMSVAKDLERIGDYCKNLWDLAAAGVSLQHGDDTEELKNHLAEVRALLVQGAWAFNHQDDETVHEVIPRIQELEKHFDEHMDRYVTSERPGKYAAPRALFFRYLKRIISHLSNVLSSVVMPVDRIDYYKKSKAID